MKLGTVSTKTLGIALCGAAESSILMYVMWSTVCRVGGLLRVCSFVCVKLELHSAADFLQRMAYCGEWILCLCGVWALSL